MKSLNVKNLFILALLFDWLMPAGAQTCDTIFSDATVTTSCSTGIIWTGGDLTIGNSNNHVLITDSLSFVSAIGTNSGVFNSLTNSTGSAIGDLSGAVGVQNNSGSTITSFFNFGTISGTSAIWNDGTINYLANYNSLTGGSGIWNTGNIGVINNLGSISVPDAAIFNETTGTIGTINNYGSIDTSASGGVGINNSGTISAINNYGSMTGAGSNGRIGNGGFIGTVNNAGTLTGGFGGWGVANGGTINTLINSGSITAGDYGGGVWNQLRATILNFTNSGSITTTGTGIQNSGNINTFINSGSINSSNGTIVTEGTITNLINIGALSAGTGNAVLAIDIAGEITTLTNMGSITAGDDGTGIANNHFIRTLNNYGSISVPNGGENAIYNTGEITNLNNYGSISAGNSTGITTVGIFNDGGLIPTLNNFGSITAGTGGVGILNNGLIATLNNSQGGNQSSPSTTALSFSGNMPTNYNIGFVSQTHYGQLSTDPGSSPTIANVGIYGTPLLTSRIYASVLLGDVTVTNLQNRYDNMAVALASNLLTNNWDMTFTGISLMGTQQSLVNTANSLAPTFTLQNSVLANSFSYDCNTFGENNICISAGGRNTAVSSANGLNNTSALLIAAYRPHPHYRIGAYADQNLSVNNAGATVNLGNNTPLIGIFGAWSERLDGTGAEVKISAAYGQKNTVINRQTVGLGESGTGSSQLNSQGAQAIAKYGFSIAEDTIASPYMGIRYTQNNMNGYSEAATTTTTLPLTYSALNTNATTALIGVGGSYKGIPQTTLFASAGIESDTNTSNGSYYGSNTGIPGITPVNFNANPIKTRPTATLGAYYDIAKNQHLGITGIYRQEPYQAVSSTTLMATYTIGL
jgi:hypothetical protein